MQNKKNQKRKYSMTQRLNKELKDFFERDDNRSQGHCHKTKGKEAKKNSTLQPEGTTSEVFG